MKTTTVGVYQNHEKAVAAAMLLKENKFTENHISIIWSKETLHDEIEKQTKKITSVSAVELATTTTLGAVAGVLTGVGLFAIPGLGFLYGAGAVIGAIAGVDLGLLGGGLVGALSILGIKREHHEKYSASLKQGSYLLLVQGEKEDMERAKEILHAHAQHTELDIH